MYAVVEVGGGQYRVSPGDQPAGSEIKLPVLLWSDDAGLKIGRPHVEGAEVNANIVGDEKGEKLIVFKYHPKKRYRLKKGHRQTYTRLKIAA